MKLVKGTNFIFGQPLLLLKRKWKNMENKITINLLVDIMMLVTIGIVSISGIHIGNCYPPPVTPSNMKEHIHALHNYGDWEREHEWGNMHLWAGIILIILLAIHILLHMKMINSFLKKICPNHISRAICYILLMIILLTTFIPLALFILTRCK